MRFILVKGERKACKKKYYAKYQKSFQDAVGKGFAQLFSANESKPKSPMRVKLEMKMKGTQNVI